MTQIDKEAANATPKRTEREVLQELTSDQRLLLKRVLEIERARLHIKAADLTDDLLGAVKAILP
jgi:hypothetical protein